MNVLIAKVPLQHLDHGIVSISTGRMNRNGGWFIDHDKLLGLCNDVQGLIRHWRFMPMEDVGDAIRVVQEIVHAHFLPIHLDPTVECIAHECEWDFS